MKLSKTSHSSAASSGKKRPRVSLPENAVFWMVLLLLTIGCTCSLYEKASRRSVSEAGSFSGTVFNVEGEQKSQKPSTGPEGTSSQKKERKARNYKVKNRLIPIYCVAASQPRVSLTFDAAWGNEDTRALMDILAKYDVKVTFFMTGGWVEKYPDDVKYIASQGHELGNHSENHKNMSQLDKKQIQKEIQTVHDRVKTLTGTDMMLFRPPYGDYDNDVVDVTDSMGYYPISWDVDSLDWKDYGTSSIVSEVLENPHLSNGSIILMHNGAKYTPQALEQIIVGLKQKGYELVPVSQLILKENFHIDHEGRQIPD